MSDPNSNGAGSSKPLYFVNEDLFFGLENDQVLVWDYRSHQQFLLDWPYFKELQSIASTHIPSDPAILEELIAANLVSEHPPAKSVWGWDLLSRIYHVGCQSVYSRDEVGNQDELAKSYLEFCESIAETPPVLYPERAGKLVDLPEPDIGLLQKTSLFDALKQRKTCRAFYAESISLNELSAILFASFGLIHGEWKEFKELGLQGTAMRKASPASGGLHSEEAYIVAYRVDGLEPGLYHYRCQDHKLTQLKAGNFEQEVISLNMEQFFSEGLAFGVYITSRFDKIWWKYKHSRAYRVTMLDIGHVSQTFLLAASALGLNTWITGAFKDDKLEQFLGIDGNKEAALLYVGAGKGSAQAIPEVMLNQLTGVPAVK
ncbi:MAG: hypothetical protein K0Q57_488 [Gammaproteobacteria bacterium]|nr:hypothetical protein [Gammaproteobacteria bacterium]